MGLKFERNKKRNILLSIFYRLSKLLFILPSKKRLTFYLNLEWIFDRLAHEESFKYYDPENHPIRVQTISFLKKHIKKNHIVLDIGCNNGFIAKQIASFSKNTIGIDNNLEMINFAKTNNFAKNIEFLHSDAFDFLKKNKMTVDVIILSHILEHINNPIDFLRKCLIHTKYIYIEVPDFEKTFLNIYRRDTNNSLNFTDSDHIWEFDRNEIIKLLLDLDLKILEIEFKNGIIRIWSTKQ